MSQKFNIKKLLP